LDVTAFTVYLWKPGFGLVNRSDWHVISANDPAISAGGMRFDVGLENFNKRAGLYCEAVSG